MSKNQGKVQRGNGMPNEFHGNNIQEAMQKLKKAKKRGELKNLSGCVSIRILDNQPSEAYREFLADKAV